MSQVIYHDSFTDSPGDERLYTDTSTVETPTPSHGPVQNVEVCHTHRVIWSQPLTVVYHSSIHLFKLWVVLAVDFGQMSIHRLLALTLL